MLQDEQGLRIGEKIEIGSMSIFMMMLGIVLTSAIIGTTVYYCMNPESSGSDPCQQISYHTPSDDGKPYTRARIDTWDRSFIQCRLIQARDMNKPSK